MDQNVSSYNVQVKEEVKISVHPLPEDNDVTNKATLHSPVNVHRPKVWAQVYRSFTFFCSSK